MHGRPWISHISYHQAQVLALRLAAACLVVVSYLSGLRPAEVLHLHTGCCPAPEGDGTGTLRCRLHGHHFKGVRDADGTPAPDGAARQWTVIPPVHTAIGILEQLTTGHLFPLRPAWLDGASKRPRRRPPAPPGTRGSRRRTGQVITAKAANGRIAEFITWVNSYARERGLDSEGDAFLNMAAVVSRTVSVTPGQRLLRKVNAWPGWQPDVPRNAESVAVAANSHNQSRRCSAPD